jgi:transglutaminase-like putative cysteine protease
MDRRSFIKTTAGFPVAALLSSVPSFGWAAAAGAGWRTFEVTTHVEILFPVGVTRVWLPVPMTIDTDYQKSFGNSWVADNATISLVKDDSESLGIVVAEWPQGVQAPVLQLTSRFATRDRAVDLGKPVSARADPAELRRNLVGTELAPIDGIVRETAQEIVKDVRGGEVEKARAIYEWIVENTYRDPKTRGCGVGDIKAMLETRNLGGKCADLNALFVGLARSIGIPARDVYGVRVAKSEYGYRSLGVGTDNITRAQHCRAEFYSPSYGWVPVDPADVRKVVLEEKTGVLLPLNDEMVSKARRRLFGSWEMNWLALNYANDVALPKSGRGKIGFFMYPQCETVEGRLDSLDPDNFKYQITAREIPA